MVVGGHVFVNNALLPSGDQASSARNLLVQDSRVSRDRGKAPDDADRHGNNSQGAAATGLVVPGAAAPWAEHYEKKRNRNSTECSSHSSEEDDGDSNGSRSCSAAGSSSSSDEEIGAEEAPHGQHGAREGADGALSALEGVHVRADAQQLPKPPPQAVVREPDRALQPHDAAVDRDEPPADPERDGEEHGQVLALRRTVGANESREGRAGQHVGRPPDPEQLLGGVHCGQGAATVGREPARSEEPAVTAKWVVVGCILVAKRAQLDNADGDGDGDAAGRDAVGGGGDPSHPSGGMVLGHIVLVQVQAIVAAFLVSIFATTVGSIMSGESSSMFTATTSRFVLDFVRVAVSLLSHKLKMNPDNLATPLAASIGDVVVIADPKLPRNYWPKGAVDRVFVSKRDGQVRSASVRTAKNTYVRPVTKLAVLEVMPSEPKQERYPARQGHRIRDARRGHRNQPGKGIGREAARKP